MALRAKPITALTPFARAANAAFISSSSTQKATQQQRPGIVKGRPGAPPPMKSTKMGTNVPLPSQEGKQGVMQYALYVYTMGNEM